MRKLYLKLLQYLCKIEINRTLKAAPLETAMIESFGARSLIQYYDFVAAQCLAEGSIAAKKVFRLSVATSQMLEYGRGRKI